MRAPLSWLREYADLPLEATGEQVAAALVRVGLEEEGVHGGDVAGPLVVARVLEFVEEPQKNGKTIRWCRLDVGEGEPSGIVCGARNFLVGDLVVVVRPGAVLPGGFAISARKTYGHVSEGMICSARELGLGDDHDGILRLTELGLDDAPVGSDAIALLGLGEQTVEVNVTPDRGYQLSLRGVAREYAHSTGAAFTDPAGITVPAPGRDGFAVRLEDGVPVRGRAGCDRYVARIVRGVAASAPSPRWMQRRLEQVGMRPISLAVDVTNYVMLALGQPLHAFDLGLMREPIVVRRARPGEKLTTLDDVERTLDAEDLLITDDGGDRVLALAGVMGGASTEVNEATTDLLIEAAHFDQITVARTARRHKLSTEASRRFERGVDTDLADRAAEAAVRLLVEFGGGEAVTVGGITDVDHREPVPPVRMAADLPARIVGVPYPVEAVVASLTAIGCRVEGADPAAGSSASPELTVTVPSWRPDLREGIDLVEEVVRLQGYDQVPSILPRAGAGMGLTHAQRARRTASNTLADDGLVEVLSYPFVGEQIFDRFGLPADDPRRLATRLSNPLSDEQPLMRTMVLETLLEVLRRNVSRGHTDLGVFEVGSVTRPVADPPAAPLPAPAVLPSEEQFAALAAAVPSQPRRVALAMAGKRELPGWWGPGRDVDWSDALDASRKVAASLGLELTVTADQHEPWHPGRCARLEVNGVLVGHAGELHPRVVAALGLPARTVAAELDLDVLAVASDVVTTAAPVSAFPPVKEDVALVVDEPVPAAEVEAALFEGAGDLLESVRLFDVYRGPQLGEGRKSLAFALVMRAPDRTLTAAEASAARGGAVEAAQRRLGAVLRG